MRDTSVVIWKYLPNIYQLLIYDDFLTQLHEINMLHNYNCQMILRAPYRAWLLINRKKITKLETFDKILNIIFLFNSSIHPDFSRFTNKPAKQDPDKNIGMNPCNLLISLSSYILMKLFCCLILRVRTNRNNQNDCLKY